MQRFESILVDVDATAVVQPALAAAATLARACGGRLRVVDVVTPPDSVDELLCDVTGDLVRDRRQRLAAVASSAADVVAGVDVLAGAPADVLIREAQHAGHDLVVRAHARDLAARGIVARGVDAELFRRCPCAVWAVGHGPLPAHPKIAAAIDIDAAGEYDGLGASVVDTARLLAMALEASLSLVHAWRPFGDRRVAVHTTADRYAEYAVRARHRSAVALDALAASCRDTGVRTRLHLRSGEAAGVIPEVVVSEGIDLLVIGAPHRTGLSRHLRGGTATRLLDRVACSVLAVRAPAAAAAAAIA